MDPKPVVVALVVALAALTASGAIGSDATATQYARAGTISADASGPRTTMTWATTAQATQTSSLGGSVSSFMQATTVTTNQTVESGMFAAKLEDSNGSERARLLRARIVYLEHRTERLERKRARLRKESGDDTVTPRERARAARVAASATALLRAINRTEATADRSGISVNESKLETLQRDAQGLTGPEVAGIETGVVDVNRGRRSDGPGRADRGGQNGSDRGGQNGSDRGGQNGSDRGGQNGSDRGGQNGSDRGGQNGSDRGGQNGSDRGGQNGSDRGGQNGSDRGGQNGSDRGGQNSSDRGG